MGLSFTFSLLFRLNCIFSYLGGFRLLELKEPEFGDGVSFFKSRFTIFALVVEFDLNSGSLSSSSTSSTLAESSLRLSSSSSPWSLEFFYSSANGLIKM